jgi:hypothetical protein
MCARRCLITFVPSWMHKRGIEVVRSVSGLLIYDKAGWHGLVCPEEAGTDRRPTTVVVTGCRAWIRQLGRWLCLGTVRVTERRDKT